jgi:hypothetical protein
MARLFYERIQAVYIRKKKGEKMISDPAIETNVGVSFAGVDGLKWSSVEVVSMVTE